MAETTHRPEGAGGERKPASQASLGRQQIRDLATVQISATIGNILRPQFIADGVSNRGQNVHIVACKSQLSIR